ncbi:Ribosomal protein S19 [Nymphaea thermarum]|nr:Ribosomal protein S19 [Nymphaea thermarum]
MARRSIWKGSFVDLFLMKKTRENEVSNVGLRSRDAKSSSAALRSSSTGVTILRKIWSRRSSISPEFVDCGVRIYNGKTPVRCKITEGKVVCFYTETKTFENKYWTGKKGEKVKSKRHMARKGNPISVRLDLNRSSDSSRFSEGDRESHRRVLYSNRRRGRTLQMSGTDTTSSNARRPQEDTRDLSMSAGVLRPCLRGTVECFYHEREVQDTRPINPANNSPMRRSLAHPGARRPAPLERPSLI